MKCLLTIILGVFLIGCTEQVTNFEEPAGENPNLNKPSRTLEKSNYTLAEHYVVEYTNEAKFLDAVKAVGGVVDYNHSAIKFGTVSNLTVKAAKKLAKKVGVKSVTQDLVLEWVSPNVDVSDEHIGSDESFWGLQWAPVAISAPDAWDAGFTGAGVRVAVIDGGISSDHMDLDDNIDFATSASFVPGFNFDEDEPGFRHATHVAGIIAAEDNGRGTIGIAPNATIIALKALHDGSGSFSAINAAIIYAAAVADADIINMSLGATFPKNAPGAAQLKKYQNAAVRYAYQNGVTVVVSAGNDELDFDHLGPYIHMPSEAQHAINVSATAPYGFAYGGTDYDTPASYTNYGQSVIDFAAPGGDFDFPYNYWWYDMVIAPSYVSGTLHYYSFSAGTSMASPHVAGVAALIVEKNGGDMKPSHVERQLRASADDLGKPGNDDYYGKGRVNAYKAIT